MGRGPRPRRFAVDFRTPGHPRYPWAYYRWSTLGDLLWMLLGLSILAGAALGLSLLPFRAPGMRVVASIGFFLLGFFPWVAL